MYLLQKVLLSSYFCITQAEEEEVDRDSYEYFLSLQERLPNYPVVDWFMMRSIRQNKSGCSKYPDLLDVEYSNRYWQLYKSHNKKETFFLYGAYLDNRKALKNGPIIRILAMINSR